MAETAITAVLAKVAELVAWEAAVLLEVGDDVRLLRDRLEWLHTFIRDADRRRRRRDDEFVAVWVRQTRDVAFEAEDALDDFLHRAARRRAPPPLPSCVAWPALCAGQVALRHGLSGRIRQITKRLEGISANRAAFNIEHTPSPAWAAPSSSATTTLASWDDLEECTVGLDMYSKMLKEQLLDDAVAGRALVSIVGKSSIGKTTLARKVYESSEIRNHFDILTWTVLPSNSRPADVLRDINSQATFQLWRSSSQQRVEDGCSGGDGAAAACRAAGRDVSNSLFQNLTGRRYLVVVDGSIAASDWNSLRASLPDEGNGSRVVLVADMAVLEVVGYPGPATYDPIELERLNPENTYEVFRRRVFGSGDCPRQHRSKYYQKIFQITRGLPLSIVILAGVLRCKELPAEWDEVMAQLSAAREPSSKNDSSRRIMSLAFDDLPHHLKSCFLYFAAMRESAEVDAQRLVRLWVAEGFVRPRRGSTMEEVGQGYLKELISRCMVQLVEKDEFDVVLKVVVHDRLHAFAQEEAQEASFIESHDSTDVLAPATVRRLAIQNSSERYVHLGNALPKLRSVVCDLVRNGGGARCIQSTDLGFLDASKFLRVIDIHGLELKKLPNEIGSMIHIRYLGLHCGQLEKLPPSVSNLVNLQSLILKGTNNAQVLDVTTAFWRIPTLRHVVAPFALPKVLGDLHSLQTLHGVQPLCWDTRGGINPMGRSTNLRSLELRGLVAKHAGALTAALESLDLLVHLVLRGESLPSAVFTIPCLRQLQRLQLVGPMDSPDGPNTGDGEAAGGMVRYIRPNLTRLSMWNTMVGQKFVDMLSELPSLSELSLMALAYDGDRLELRDGGFRSLQKLKLALPELEEWTVRAGAMASLASLTLLRCAKMRMLPEALAGIPELKEVVLFRMPRMVERIKKRGGEDHHKIKHVLVIQTLR
ncbi:disease resistance protein RPP13-like [Oryza brachyantha]|uniref:disease resistance protein RPP13-like n=1 Tax=Oryza brachyantha TaxID=4533 RepID=UPI001ADCD8AF|nr:disease resistance protein RPP13-like [Oryza brachyantha]